MSATQAKNKIYTHGPTPAVRPAPEVLRRIYRHRPSVPRAITSGQKTKADANTRRNGGALAPATRAQAKKQCKTKTGTDAPNAGDHRHRLIIEHWPRSIFTRWIALQFRHQSWRLSATVSGLIAWLVLCRQTGQTAYPSFMASLSPFFIVCKAFPSLSRRCP